MRGTALHHVPPSAHGVQLRPGARCTRAAPGVGRPNAGGSRSRATVARLERILDLPRERAGGSRSRSTVACAWRPDAYPTRLKSRSRHLAAVRPVTARAYRARQEASIVASSTRLGSKSASMRSSTRVTTSGTPSIASR